MIRRIQLTPIVLALGLISGSAHAALQGRDLNGSLASFEAYYDTDLDITWLANANVNGSMNWADANTWAANLSFTDGTNVYADWRLPTVNPINGVNFNYATSYDGSTDVGYNVSEQGTTFAGSTASEMAHLFYNTLNNKGYCPVSSDCSPAPQPGWGLTNTGPFTNLQAGSYWSVEYADSISHSWAFDFSDGGQRPNFRTDGFYALAVSPGDVGNVAPVPVPAAVWLLGSGLLGLIGVARRKATPKM